ncbi:MAG: CorA family divalent cation transporter [Candidatus Paceibacterota bacterium]
MTKTHTYRGLAWIDMESPDDNEISSIIRRYDLHPLVGEELKSSSTLAKIDIYKDYVLVVLTLPVRLRKNGSSSVVNREIDFVIGKNFLITSRYDTIDQLEYFAKIFETNSIIDKDEKIDHAGNLFHYMIKRIYAGMLEDLENIRDSLQSSEAKIFGGDERNMVRALSNLSREIIDFRQTARIHREVWEELIAGVGETPFGNDFLPYVHDMRDDFNKIHELIANCRELLVDLRETNDSLLTSKQNEVIKTLTLVAFIFYPLTFIASLFTIPSPFTPVVSHPQGWYILLFVMVVMAIGIGIFFKRKKWF